MPEGFPIAAEGNEIFCSTRAVPAVLIAGGSIAVETICMTTRSPGVNRPLPTRMKRTLYCLLFVAVLAGYLLFCHGCHADQDTELLLRAQQKGPQAWPAGR